MSDTNKPKEVTDSQVKLVLLKLFPTERPFENGNGVGCLHEFKNKNCYRGKHRDPIHISYDPRKPLKDADDFLVWEGGGRE